MFDDKSYSLKMDKTIDVFVKEMSSLRTGRANAAMLDLVKVDVYGQHMPINQVGSITTPEPRMINIQVWDQNNVSLVDAVMEVEKETTVPEINQALKEEASRYLGYSEEPLVSIDYQGNPHSSVIDADSTKVIDGTLVKVLTWYDNEWGYSNRVLDLILHMEANKTI